MPFAKRHSRRSDTLNPPQPTQAILCPGSALPPPNISYGHRLGWFEERRNGSRSATFPVELSAGLSGTGCVDLGLLGVEDFATKVGS